jgi:PEP-CTERM motif
VQSKLLLTALATLTLAAAAAAAQAAPIYADDFDANPVALNTAPAGWTVSNGTVDIIGTNFSGSSYDFLPGHGAYIDLDGSTGQSGLLGTLVSLTGGVQYTASFDLAGSQRGSTETGTVMFGTNSLEYVIDSAAGFATRSIVFTPAASGLYALSFQNAGGDNVGALLDNVSVTAAVPEPGTYALLAIGLVAVGAVARRRRPNA